MSLGENPTTLFDLITFYDVQLSTYNSNPCPRKLLRPSRVLFAKTKQGNLAKFKVRTGANLTLRRLVVYSPGGCIINSVSNIVIRPTLGCDLDAAIECATGGDFQWQDVGNELNITPLTSVRLHIFRGFDEVTFDELVHAAYHPGPLPAEILDDQLIFVRLPGPRFAKILLAYSGAQVGVWRLAIYDPHGKLLAENSNILQLSIDNHIDLEGTPLWFRKGEELRLESSADVLFSCPSYFCFRKYVPLLQNQDIRTAMVWVNDAGVGLHYDSWPEKCKLQLKETVYLRETNGPRTLDHPPTLLQFPGDAELRQDRYFSSEDAWKIYLAHVAQSLWIDANRVVPWTLAGRSQQYLQHLLSCNFLMWCEPGYGYSFERSCRGNVTDWAPDISYKFLLEAKLLASDPLQTVYNITDWCRINLQHIIGYQYDPDGPFASQADQWEYIFGYRSLPPVDRMIYPLHGKHITHGCAGTTGFLVSVLGTANIPVANIGIASGYFALHNRPQFFSVGQNLAHGDDPYFAWVRKGNFNCPIDRIFMDDTTITTLIENPPANVSESNYNQFFIRLAVEFETDYLLYLRCQDLQTGAVPPGGKLYENLCPYYSNAEIDQIAQDCDAALANITGACAGIQAF